MAVNSPGIRLWDDNPSSLDFLGFDAVVDPIIAAVREHHIHPLTLSVQSPWVGANQRYSSSLKPHSKAIGRALSCPPTRGRTTIRTTSKEP